jgi:hypothetical protein
MIEAKVTAQRAIKRTGRPRFFAPSSEPEIANEDVDCLHIMQECMKFFLRRAIEAADEKTSKKFARDADVRLRHWLDTIRSTIASGVRASICATSSRLKHCTRCSRRDLANMAQGCPCCGLVDPPSRRCLFALPRGFG